MGLVEFLPPALAVVVFGSCCFGIAVGLRRWTRSRLLATSLLALLALLAWVPCMIAAWRIADIFVDNGWGHAGTDFYGPFFWTSLVVLLIAVIALNDAMRRQPGRARSA